MNWFKQFTGPQHTVGIELLPEGLAVAVRNPSPESASIQVINMLSDEVGDIAEQLEDFVASHGLKGAPCNMVLPQGEYQLLLVEAPDVPEQELREAIRWRIKDLISTPLENTAIEVFKLPTDGVRGGKKMVYVVTADLNKIKQVIALANQAGLELKTIDIVELAIRNLSLLKNEGQPGERGIGIARITQGAGTVSFYREGNLYLSRQFQINYDAGLLDDLPADHLILELQRSLDYYERQMGQKPPVAVYLCGDNISEDKVTSDLSRALSAPLKYLAIDEMIQFAAESDSRLAHLCVGALGGALRTGVSP